MNIETNRLIKLATARRLHRASRRTLEAQAQEPQISNPRIELKQTLKIGSLNVRGLIAAGERKEIEAYMFHKQIHILMIQETHIGEETRSIGKYYSWYFSGGTKPEKTIPHGVGIIIDNKCKDYVEDVEAISTSMIKLKLRPNRLTHHLSIRTDGRSTGGRQTNSMKSLRNTSTSTKDEE